MSNQDLEEVRVGQDSMEIPMVDRTNSVVSSSGYNNIQHSTEGKREQEQYSCCKIKRLSAGDVIRSIRDTLDLDTFTGYWGFVTAYIIVIFIYPLHYYAYVINGQKNCLEIDNILYGTFYIVALSNAYMLLYIPKVFIKMIRLFRDRKSVTYKIIEHFGFTQIPISLMTLTVLPDLATGRKNKVFLMTMNLFLLGYMLLVIGLSITLTNASKSSSGRIASAKWAKAVFNLLLYLHGGHVFGAIWYSFAIERVVACWKEAYPHQIAFVKCADYHDLQHQLSCSKTMQAGKNVTEFGIFNAALLSGIVEKKTFLEKYIYCLRWGLQTLSCFGQNLEPTTFPAENIFVISVTIYSTVLFVFLIGNMQTYLQSETSEKKKKKILHKQNAEQWMFSRGLSVELIKEVKECQETETFKVENFFNNLPEQLIGKIKLELGLRRLKKVEEFINRSDVKVEDLCKYVKPVFYTERARIVREGDPIDEMLVVVQGELWTYSSRGITTPPDHLEAEEFFGEELVAWAKDEKSSSSNLPISTRTVQALTDVEALVLMANDLKKIFISYKQKLSSNQPDFLSDQTVGGSEITIR